MPLHIPHSGEDPQNILPASSFTTASEHGQEVERLSEQQRLLSELIGGALPPSVNMPQEGWVLDVGCGAGTWVYEMARCYPSLQIVGIDNNASSIQQARQLTRNLPNVLFLLQDMHHLEGEIFTPDTFVLIHLRFLADNVLDQHYPRLLQALTRLLKAGGRLISCEAELPLTSSRACDVLGTMLLRALIKQDRAFSRGLALRIGIVAWILYWLHQVGLVLENEQSYLLQVSYGTKAHGAFCRQVAMFAQQIRLLLVEAGVVSNERYEQVCQQMKQEIEAKIFYGVWPIHLVVAMKQERQEMPREMQQSAYADYREGVRVSA